MLMLSTSRRCPRVSNARATTSSVPSNGLPRTVVPQRADHLTGMMRTLNALAGDPGCRYSSIADGPDTWVRAVEVDGVRVVQMK